MTKASDNEFPSLLVKEGSAPASPASGDQRIFIDSADHHFKRKNSSGTVTDLESGSAAAYSTAHGARVKRASSNFSVGNNTLTAIAFDAEDTDTDSIHDNVTNNTRLTIPTISGVTTGLWHVSACGYTDANGGNVDCQFYLNGTTPIAFERTVGSSSGVSGFSLGIDYVFSAADYVECRLRTTSGSFNAVYDAGNSPIFSIAFLGKVT